MNLFKLMATLGMDDTEYKKGLDKAEKGASSLKSKIVGLGIGTAVAGIGKAAVDAGMNFEQAMAGVAGTMGITSDEIAKGNESFEKLKKAAKDAGATTKFSASEAAEGLGYMALAGLNAEQSVTLLPKVLDAAAASGMDLASASDLVTDGMSALGISVDGAGEFMDKITKTSQKSNTSFAQLGDALLTVGGTAKVLKGGVTEANTALGILADNGIKGAEGGTALRNVILSLSSPTDKSSKLMKKLGLNVFDSSGKMRNMQDILNDLNKILGKMTDQERTKALSTMFNKVDLKSVNALLANSTDRWTELSAAIDDSKGVTEETAKTMNDTLKGKLTEMGSALEGLGIAFYEKIEQPLKDGVKFLTDLFSKLIDLLSSGKLDKQLALIGSAIGGIVAYLAVIKTMAIISKLSSAIGVIVNVVKSVKSLQGAIALLNAVMAANPIGMVAMVIGTLVSAFIYLWTTSEGFRNFWIGLWNKIKEIVDFAGGWIYDFFKNTLPNSINNAIEYIKGIPERLANFFEKLKTDIKTFFTNLWEWIKTKAKEKWTQFTEFIKQIPQKLREIGIEIGTNIGNFIKNIWNFFTVSIPAIYNNIIKWFKELPGEIWKWLKNAFYATVKWGYDMMVEADKSAREFVDNVIKWFKELPTKVKNWFTEVIKKVINWKDDMVKKAKETGSEFTKWLKDSLKNLPKDMMNIGKDIVNGVWQGIKNAKEWFTSSVKGFFGGIVDGVKSTLGIHSPSRVFRDEVGQWIPAGVEVGVKREMPNLKRSLDDEFSELSNMSIESPELNIYKAQEDFMGKLKKIKIEIPLEVDGREFTRVAVAPFQDELQEYKKTHDTKYRFI